MKFNFTTLIKILVLLFITKNAPQQKVEKFESFIQRGVGGGHYRCRLEMKGGRGGGRKLQELKCQA